MVYDIKTVPEDTPLWCAGFRFDDTKAGIKCEPVFGTFEERSCYSKFHTLSNKTRSKTFSVGQILIVIVSQTLMKKRQLNIMV